ncbi:DUF4142 domain-containing protein [Streptosporangium sp. NPDC023825]|uniref:DUF4142 domain-containing protein n=1 Tax=Streptosporangium sp. NPDC023825 TaxID=3154909 RepID=UPI0034203F09
MVRMMLILLTIVVAAMAGTAGAAVPPAPEPVSRQDWEFLVKAHQGSLAEIEAGLAVRRKAQSQDGKVGRAVRELGEQLIVDHMRLDRLIRQVADEMGVKLPDEPSAAQRKQLEEVMALGGAEFDRAWIDMEIASHRNGVILVRQQVENSSDPRMRKLAFAVEQVVRTHLNMFLHVHESPVPSPSKS